MIKISSSWQNINFKLEIVCSKEIEDAITYYFKPWINQKNKSYDYLINLCVYDFKNTSPELVKTKLFNYERNLINNSIATKIYINRYKLHYLKSIYKRFIPSNSSIGINELVMAILRTGVFEPIEFFLTEKNYYLFHASSVILNKKPILFLGESKMGKSTLFKFIYSNYIAQSYLGDNYVFFNGKNIKTIAEPQRSGIAKNISYSYYGRDSKHLTDLYDATANSIVLLNRSNKNRFIEIDSNFLSTKIIDIHNKAKEGIEFLPNNDILKKEYFSNPPLTQNIFQLDIASGLENYNFIKSIIKDIK